MSLRESGKMTMTGSRRRFRTGKPERGQIGLHSPAGVSVGILSRRKPRSWRDAVAGEVVVAVFAGGVLLVLSSFVGLGVEVWRMKQVETQICRALSEIEEDDFSAQCQKEGGRYDFGTLVCEVAKGGGVKRFHKPCLE